MKNYVLILFATFCLSTKMNVYANVANVVFQSSDPALMLVKLDGKAVNFVPQLGMRILNVFAGNHFVEFNMVGNNGETIKYTTSIYLEPYVETSYLLYHPSVNSYFLYASSKISLIQPSVVYNNGLNQNSLVVISNPIVNNQMYAQNISVYDMAYPIRSETVYKPDFDVCTRSLSIGMRDSIVTEMRHRSLDSDKYRAAKLGISSNGLRVKDMAAILKEFNWDDTKLNFVRTTYTYVCDKSNFFHLKGVFKHVSTEKELEEYISAVNMLR